MICGYCNWDKPMDSSFWETHPTMPNGEWYCVEQTTKNIFNIPDKTINDIKREIEELNG